MRLKCIKLAGFKSFVDPTTVNFPRNMSAIVGPNGCGKSNVIDAVRWVMGEMSAKHLRGESMADVIFNGSTSRKPLGLASVELVFDNSDGSLGGEYAAFAEISIKRKVTRDGQSDYFLNSARCRRKDITDIFLGTGLGPRSYAIIEQGMISRLIEAKPDELRVYIEEAAGISRYKERRKDTEARMRRTRENLERLTDIRDELERQLERLKRQAAAAEKYRELKQQERQLRGELRAVQWRSLDADVRERAQRIAELELAQEAVITRQGSLDAGIDKQRVALADLSDEHNRVQADFYGLGEKIALIEQQLRHQQERKQQLTQDLEQARRSHEDTLRHLEEDQSKVGVWQQELDALQPRLEQAQALEADTLEALQSAEQAMQDWQSRWDHFNEAAAVPKRDAEVQQSRIQHLESGLARLATRSRQLRDEQAGLGQDQTMGELDQQRQRLAGMDAQMQSAQSALDGLVARMQQQRQQVAEHSTALDAMRTRLQQQRGRYASLETLQQSALAEDDARVREWLAAHGLEAAPRLASRLSVAAGWERAVETVLGRYLEAVCVDAIAPLAPSLEGFEGGLSLMEHAAVPAGAVASAGSSLLDKVDEAGSLVPLLARIECADSLEQALARRDALPPEVSLVTPDGAWVGRGWIVLNPADKQKSGVLQRAREIEALQQALATDAQLAEQQAQALAAAREALQGTEAEREAAEQQLRQLGREQGEVRAEISAREARLEALQRRRESLVAQLQDSESQYQSELGALEMARKALQEAIEAMAGNEARREQLLGERDRMRGALDEARHKARQCKDAHHQLAVQVQTLRTQQQAVSGAMARLRERLQETRQQQQQLAEALAGTDAPLAELREQLETLLAQRLQVEAALVRTRQVQQAAEHAVRQMESERHAVEQELSRRRAELEQLRLDAQTLTVRRRTIEEQLQEDQQDLQALLAGLPEAVSESEWQINLQQVSNRIQQLGSINLAAIDEYRQQSERKVYLDTQNADLVEALETLENAIRKIDRETRARFQETFDRINEGLQELFPKVFGGGKACLEMTGDDLLDTGVAIMARPPGKTNASIHLLSGGEKALTAIALVFSIFQLNPAPFCMLDEVDAPLDDINTGRYARMVREMSGKVQFIYITHNKISMEVADHLMGVTMQEPGVSRMVSVDIDEAAEMALA